MYSFPLYGDLIADAARTRPYVEALRQAVTPRHRGARPRRRGDRLLRDAGLSVRAPGACSPSRSTTRSPSRAQVAAANGFSDRIDFFQGSSTDIALPERADVIISDLHGVLPLNGDAILTLVDARERLLAPGGRFIPARETLWVAGVDAPDLYDVHTMTWDATVYDLDLGSARGIMLNRLTRALPQPRQVRLEPRRWTTLDYATITDAGARGRFAWVAGEATTIHGCCVLV